LHTWKIPYYFEDDENYCPKAKHCTVANFPEAIVPGTMWADKWHDYIQGKSAVLHELNHDGSYGVPIACCNVYAYKLKELEGDDDQNKIQL